MSALLQLIAPHVPALSEVIELVGCPDPSCPAPAAITQRWFFDSSDGPLEHVRIVCSNGHIFTPLAKDVLGQR
jgi:hypothetical protein